MVVLWVSDPNKQHLPLGPRAGKSYIFLLSPDHCAVKYSTCTQYSEKCLMNSKSLNEWAIGHASKTYWTESSSPVRVEAVPHPRDSKHVFCVCQTCSLAQFPHTFVTHPPANGIIKAGEAGLWALSKSSAQRPSNGSSWHDWVWREQKGWWMAQTPGHSDTCLCSSLGKRVAARHTESRRTKQLKNVPW